MIEQRLVAMVEAATMGILATRRADGRPQQSPVSYAFDPDRAVLRISTTADRAKTVNLARDPRASLLVMGPTPWSYAVAQVRAQVLPVAASADDESVAELRDIYRAIAGEHADWADFDRAMVADRRVPIHLHVERYYGAPPPE
ncbi:MAG: PPOX class F420-dependent oxidoreductase [Dermatophilaceae bacterium]